MKKRIEKKTEIAVIGAGPAGLSAAITAAREGKRVLLVEKNGYLGGNATLGLPLLGFLDTDGKRIVGGLAQEYVSRLTARGQCFGHRVCPKHNSVTNIDPEGFKLLAIEMCREAGVEIILHAQACDAEVENGVLRRVLFYGKGTQLCVEADVFIDCTGDGDVAYLADCSFEAGQPQTGVLQPPTVMYTLENVETALLFDHIERHPEEMTYSASIDHRAGYDADYFRASPNHVFVGLSETFARLRAQGKCPVERNTLIYINSTKQGEVFVNSTRLLGTDATDLFDLTKAELEGQLQAAALTEMLREHVPGFANCFISSIAPSLGVRETRRFKGLRTLTGDMLLDGVIGEDSIALGAYKIDIHSGTDRNTLFKTVKAPFGIPYGCLVSAELDNLMLAGRCASMDAAALASARVMPQCMSMGEAAGLAAAMAVRDGVLPKEVNVSELRASLLDRGVVLTAEQASALPVNEP